MPSIVIKEPDDTRSIIYNASESDEPIDKPFTYVHPMPIEVERIQKATPEEVQKILRRYI